jgi:mono/diheme cytochrome c family protein
MRSRVVLLAVTGAAVVGVGVIATGCFQELNPDAASGGALPDPEARSAELPDGGESTWELCQSPSCDSIDGAIPLLTETPPVYLADAATTTDPCAQVEQASMVVRQTYCAGCHQSPASQGGLSFVLDDSQLAAATAQSATSDAGAAQKLVVAGNPLQSPLYQTVAQGLSGASTGMPPVALAGYPSIPRPTASDVSILYAWIVACLPGAGGYVSGGVDYAPAADAGAE